MHITRYSLARYPFCYAKLGAAAARVAAGFLGACLYRFAVDGPQGGLAAAYADRVFGRAYAALLLLPDEELHDTVFERVERNHRQPAARLEHAHRGLQAFFQYLKLAVDGDAQRLEGLGGWVDGMARAARYPAAQMRRRLCSSWAVVSIGSRSRASTMRRRCGARRAPRRT